MLLNRHNLAIHTHASRGATRSMLGGVHIEEGGTVATDGHRLAHVTLPDMPVDEYPDRGGLDRTSPWKSRTIPAVAAKALHDAIPKNGKHPILRTALVDHGPADAFQAITTALENGRTVTATPIDGEFPHWRNVLPKGKPKAVVHLSGAYLAEACKLLGAFNGRSHLVKLEVFDEASPVRLTATDAETGQVGTIIIMPTRP